MIWSKGCQNVSGDGMYKLSGIIFVVLASLLIASPALAQDLTVDKMGKPDTVKVGEPITYTLTVSNTNTTTPGANVVVEDTLPKQVKYLGADNDICVKSGRVVTCTIPTLTSTTPETIKLFVQAQNEGDAKNVAEVFDNAAAATAGTEDDRDTVTTNIKKKDSSSNPSDGHKGPGDPRDRNGDGRISQAEEALNAAEDLNSVEDESTDGENTSSSLDASDPANDSASANADENGAEASTPGAVASANGDEDTLGPVGPQGDVVNDIPESGPLPNTGGISLLALAMPVLGIMLLGVALVARMRK